MDRRTVLTESIGALTLLAGCLRSEPGGPASGSSPTVTTATTTPPSDGGTEPDGGPTPTVDLESGIRLRYAYYPEKENLWVHHDGGKWLYEERGDRLLAVGENGSWTVFGPDDYYLLFAIGATQGVSEVPPGTKLDLVYVPTDGAEQVLDTVTTPTEEWPIPTGPEYAPWNAVWFAYDVGADRTELTVTHDGGPDMAADRVAVHVEGRTTPWVASDGTVSEGDAQTVPLEPGDQFVKVSWHPDPDEGWVGLVGNHILES